MATATVLDRLVEQLATLIAIPSVHPLHGGPRAEAAGPLGEAAYARHLADRLGVLGAEVELEDVFPDRPNLYATVPGRTDRVVALDCHLDTVSVEHCVGDPFVATVDDEGRLHGRGACDTKASIAVLLDLLDEWADRGLRPEPTLLVVGTASEEQGGLPGAVAFRGWAEERGLEIEQLMIAEPTSCAPVHGHPGGLALRVHVTGTAAHTSMPELGRNAIAAAARAIQAVDAESDRLLARPHPRGTVQTTLIEGGRAANVVPDECRFTIGRRIAHGEDPAEEQARLESIVAAAVPPCDVSIRLVNDSRSAAFHQDPASPWVRQLAEWSGAEPCLAPYGSNALKYGGLAGETVVLGPGSIEQAHQADEWVDLDELTRLRSIYERWLRPG
ncbi:MAG: M20/M25/M40 family metallo-hydrolase [Actinomycetota bacterium]